MLAHSPNKLAGSNKRLLLTALNGTEDHTPKTPSVTSYPLAAGVGLSALTGAPPPAAGALGLLYYTGQSWVGQSGT